MKAKPAQPKRSPDVAREQALWISAKSSSAVEGICKPFAQPLAPDAPATTEQFIAKWTKRRAAASAR